MSGAAGKYKACKKYIQPYKTGIMFFSDVLDDNKGDGKVGRPDKQVALVSIVTPSPICALFWIKLKSWGKTKIIVVL